MSAAKQEVHTHSKPKRTPNLLSTSTVLSINSLVGGLMGVDGLLNEDDDSLDFATSYLKRVFWSKYSSPGASRHSGKRDVSPAERQSRSIEKWIKTEKRNEKTNHRLIFESCDFGFGTSGQISNLARKYIRETIGNKPPKVISGSFTGGASTRINRGAGSIASKFMGKAHCSDSAKPWFAPILFGAPTWQSINPLAWDLETQNSSVLFTVPKNSEIDRVACKEPEINMYLQRGLGDFIRLRLKRHGIDLNDQSRNKDLARESSRTRSHATIDLSSASDTISNSVVRMLLPYEWYNALDCLRSRSTVLPDGSVHSLEMFSSMGNGFTFELETLVFWALARAVSCICRVRGKILVYGDDIVAPIPCALALRRVLPWFGFAVNVKKTFTSGPFRESCGGHYVNGSDVTPFYFREKITSMTQVIQLGNQLSKWMLVTHQDDVTCYPPLLALNSFIQDLVPVSLHGGQSLERTDALVTGGPPRRRLVQTHKRQVVSQEGSLLWWYHEKDRKPERVFSPTESAELGRWVLRPNSSWYDRDLMADVRYLLPSTLRNVDGTSLFLA